MLGRVFAIAMNTYREAVRARVLYGLLALALVASSYSMVVAAMSLRQETRIVADIGAASMSLLAVIVSIILGATSLYRELELKTVFPILTRKLRRHEYVVGKYLGIVATVASFVCIHGAVVFSILIFQAKEEWRFLVVPVLASAVLAALLVRMKQVRVFVVLPWSIALFVIMASLAGSAGGERQLVLVSATLTIAEVVIISAVAMLFSSFSSPFLTAIFTLMVFLIGRSADTLGNLPERVFGHTVHTVGKLLSRIFPNLNLYVPARPVLLGQVDAIPLAEFITRAWVNALLYAVVLMTVSAYVFRKRDFQ